MLRWERTGRPHEWDMLCGEARVGAAYADIRGRWHWHVMRGVIGGAGVLREQGAISERDAKSAAEAAFTAWLKSARLVHLPDGYQIVPKVPTPEMIAAGDYECMRSELPTTDMWRAMLAAAKTAQDGRE